MSPGPHSLTEHSIRAQLFETNSVTEGIGMRAYEKYWLNELLENLSFKSFFLFSSVTVVPRHPFIEFISQPTWKSDIAPQILFFDSTFNSSVHLTSVKFLILFALVLAYSARGEVEEYPKSLASEETKEFVYFNCVNPYRKLGDWFDVISRPVVRPNRLTYSFCQSLPSLSLLFVKIWANGKSNDQTNRPNSRRRLISHRKLEITQSVEHDEI